MAKKINPFFKNLFRRDLIKKDEGKLTYVQIYGFVLITIGIVYFASFLLPVGIIDLLPFLHLDEHPDAPEVSIAFFTTMLGVAFAFPDLLKGQTNEISTMRIIVFMFTNVICMLLLKFGWQNEAKSLADIKLDQWWMGVIAFLFGAKAAQSYFENRSKLFNPSGSSSPGPGNLRLSELVVAQIAKVQNEGTLHMQFPNIISFSDTLLNDKACLTLYIEDENVKDIPAFVPAKLNENNIVQVQTKILAGSLPAKPYISQSADEIKDSFPASGIGSFCCLIRRGDDFVGLVTAGHNFTQGNFKNLGGFQFGNAMRDVFLNNAVIGKLYYQKMNFTQDMAIVEVTNVTNLMTGYKSFSSFYKVTQSDVKSFKNVTIESRPNINRRLPDKRDACIIDCNISYPLNYYGIYHDYKNVVLLADSPEPNSRDVSAPGDSGGCVYLKDTDQLIGILIGGNGKYSVALPIEEILSINNFKIL
jgi:hypothetical protein